MKLYIPVKKSILFILVLAAWGVLYASVTLQYFTAREVNDGILIEWKTGDEGGTTRFDIERSAVNPDNFIFLKSISATGNNSYYSYLDNSVTRANNSSIVYYYRLKCIQQNGSYVYSNVITVIHSVSGIKNTWGSIKAIFR